MYKIKITYVIPSGGKYTIFNLYTEKFLRTIEENIKDIVIRHNIEFGDGVKYDHKSITYAKIEQVKYLRALIYA